MPYAQSLKKKTLWRQGASRIDSRCALNQQRSRTVERQAAVGSYRHPPGVMLAAHGLDLAQFRDRRLRNVISACDPGGQTRGRPGEGIVEPEPSRPLHRSCVAV